MTDEAFIEKTLELAEKGRGLVSPNPMVGAVIVKNNGIIAEGFHQRFGGEHAEVVACNKARESVKGATLYVNLEPCSHYGKQPPCVERIVQQGIERVVIGTRDPNPIVDGSGIRFLQEHGVQVQAGVLENRCEHLNEAYFKYVKSGLPLTTLKIAQTLDGRIATKTGASKWITSEPARRYAHQLRSQNDAILVGIGTVLSDDPQLTVRLVEGVNPIRFVLDSLLRIPLSARILSKELAG
ncbi:MAG: bifunctional diaminohydroxyphosphoribosylaminopyrimidine deaminase/5-amino-6-(5-phosphoribosylamino)uracil reductase RibD, partial [bacterium]